MKIRGDISLGQHSHVGMVRTANEDFFGYWEPDDDGVFDRKGRVIIVCDGMGGHHGGEIASRMAVKEVIDSYKALDGEDIVDNLRQSIEQANRAVFGEGRQHPELAGMGTTVTAVVHRKSIVYFGQVGDSRAYLIRGGAMKQMTKDHSLVQQLVDEGLLDASEMENHPDKNVILRSLGVKPEVDVDVSHVPVVDEDLLLLCSDGLSGLISDDEMLRTVNEGMANGGQLRKICETLVDKANAAGGHDNITVQILQIHTTDVSKVDKAPIQAVTADFTEDEIQASIAAAKADAAARGGAAPAAGGAGPQNLTVAMPVPTMDGAASSGGGGGGEATNLLGMILGLVGFLVGLGVGAGVMAATSGGEGAGPPSQATADLLEGARSQAQQARAEETPAYQEAAGQEERDPLGAALGYLDAAAAAEQAAATKARQEAEAKSKQLSGKNSPLVAKALEQLTEGTVALQERRYSTARARFEAAKALFAGVEGAE